MDNNNNFTNDNEDEPNDNDAWTGTENQHDFGKRKTGGLTTDVLLDQESQEYRDYVDRKFSWNATNNNRGATHTRMMPTGQYIQVRQGEYTTNNNPLNHQTPPQWAYSDDGILRRVIHMGKQELQGTSNVPHPGWVEQMVNSPMVNTPNDTGEHIGPNNEPLQFRRHIIENLLTYSFDNRKDGKRYRVTRVAKPPRRGANNKTKGRVMCELLEIPNHSIIIVDTDQMLSKQFKTNSSNNNNWDREFHLYIFSNPIVNADTATAKPMIHSSSIFNDYVGITIKAVLSNKSILVKGQNNDIKMNFDIKNMPNGATINQANQDWIPQGDNWADDDFAVVNNITKIVNCKANNNISKMKVSAFKLRSGDHMKAPPDDTRTHDKQEFNRNILCLARKRGGDLFQGWLAKNLFRPNLEITNVRVCMDIGDATDLVKADLSARDGEPGYCPSFGLNADDAPWNVAGGPNVIHDTGDYPHLAWCLENGLNVLFGATGTKNFFYFHRTN